MGRKLRSGRAIAGQWEKAFRGGAFSYGGRLPGGYCPAPDCVVQGTWGEDISAFPTDEWESKVGHTS